jgi:hypothetical protein
MKPAVLLAEQKQRPRPSMEIRNDLDAVKGDWNQFSGK